MELRDNDRLDRWLDGALQQYGSAEPRGGIEGRILATIAAERQRLALRWRWGLAVASVLAICGALALWRGSFLNVPHTNKTVVVQVPIEQSRSNQIAPQMQEDDRGKLRIRGAAENSRRARKLKTVELASEPRLEQFPSPRPLSEQEQLLKRYVRDFPGQAEMVARAQADRQKEIEKLLAYESSKINSDQQER
jgi:hypothetical protein